ncbi:hypothetical protein [Streptomyces sp. NPDC093111]|uniref:hypothetical protein n=1 Tax=Streptomyces sp. NPDC093111 TaxID=3154978 RepID=UPI0034414A95
MVRTIGWCSISAVIPAGQNIWPLRTAAPELSLTTGHWRVLRGLSTHSATDAQAHLDTLTAAHAAHRASCQTCTA